MTISYAEDSAVREEVDVHINLTARLAETIETGLSEKISIIELPARIDGFAAAPIRARPLEKDELVVGVGYRGSDVTLQYAKGHFSPLEPSDGEPDPDAEPPEPFLYFDVSNEEGRDRYVFDHGTSGAPLFDCEGALVALAVGLLEPKEENLSAINNAMKNFGFKYRIPFPHSMPNLSGVSTSNIPVK